MLNTKESEFSTLRSASSLTFRQALYQFPYTKIAVLDEDGVIVATNPAWEGGKGHEISAPHHSSPLGASFFDICRSCLSSDDANKLVADMKKIILGAPALLATFNCTCEHTNTEKSTRLFACPISDSPNSLLVAYDTLAIIPGGDHWNYRDLVGSRGHENRHFA